MIQEYQVSGFRVREYEELRSTNTEAERGVGRIGRQNGDFDIQTDARTGTSRESLGK